MSQVDCRKTCLQKNNKTTSVFTKWYSQQYHKK